MGIPVSGKNLVPFQHPGSANLVHHPCQQGWFRRPARDQRDRHRDEPRPRSSGTWHLSRPAEPFSTPTTSNCPSTATDIAVYPMPVKAIVRARSERAQRISATWSATWSTWASWRK
ncbi:MAG: hypothetical protein M0C28_34395 [Candidatus Moduliflexus flocculans]|nr:hypothetical protein [Candidatus Moduliflexus flocculans]